MQIVDVKNARPTYGATGSSTLVRPAEGPEPTRIGGSHRPSWGRWQPVGLVWGLVALTLALVPIAVLVEMAIVTQSTTSRLVLSATLAQLMLIAGAAALYSYRHTHAISEMGEVIELGSRAEMAEAALSREQERLHELRATVVGISLAHRLLHERRTELTGSVVSRLERLRETELGRLERLLADKPREALEAVDLRTVVDPLVDSLELRGHRVRWGGTRCEVLGRSDDVAEILQGLLENAVRHGRGCDVDLDVVTRGAWVEVRVSDNGPGVDPTLVPELFERGARRPGSPGQGIGLHIARRLSVAMGGRLTLDPTSRNGATFVLTLPATAGASTCLAHSG